MEQQGVGLGLSIAHELIRLHLGQIIVDSVPGQGSTFTILLPCGQTG
jgi:signal transduction histidine kinase